MNGRSVQDFADAGGQPKTDRFSETCQVSGSDRPGWNPKGYMAAVGWIRAAHPPMWRKAPNRDTRQERPKTERFRKPVRFVSAAIAKGSLASSPSPCEVVVRAFPCGPDQPLASPGERLAMSGVEWLAMSGVERQRTFGPVLNFGGCAALIHPTAFEAPSPASSHSTSHG